MTESGQIRVSQTDGPDAYVPYVTNHRHMALMNAVDMFPNATGFEFLPANQPWEQAQEESSARDLAAIWDNTGRSIWWCEQHLSGKESGSAERCDFWIATSPGNRDSIGDCVMRKGTLNVEA